MIHITRVLTLLFAATALLFATSAPASASGIEYGVNMRPCTNTSSAVCAPTGTTGGGGEGSMICWEDGSYAQGRYGSARWFLVQLHDKEGFIHSSFVTRQTGVTHCDNIARVRMAKWALAQIGQTHARAEDDIWTASDWAPGPVRQWGYDCAKFASAGARRAGIGFPRGNAVDQKNHFARHGALRGGLPAYGQPVFYNVTRWGHVAISLGNGVVASTMGTDYNTQPVQRVGLHHYSNYAGWGVAS